jgi:hypothetical protein
VSFHFFLSPSCTNCPLGECGPAAGRAARPDRQPHRAMNGPSASPPCLVGPELMDLVAAQPQSTAHKPAPVKSQDTCNRLLTGIFAPQASVFLSWLESAIHDASVTSCPPAEGFDCCHQHVPGAPGAHRAIRYSVRLGSHRPGGWLRLCWGKESRPRSATRSTRRKPEA